MALSSPPPCGVHGSVRPHADIQHRHTSCRCMGYQLPHSLLTVCSQLVSDRHFESHKLRGQIIFSQVERHGGRLRKSAASRTRRLRHRDVGRSILSVQLVARPPIGTRIAALDASRCAKKDTIASTFDREIPRDIFADQGLGATLSCPRSGRQFLRYSAAAASYSCAGRPPRAETSLRVEKQGAASHGWPSPYTVDFRVRPLCVTKAL